MLGLIFLNLNINAQTSEYKIFYFSGKPKVIEKGQEKPLVRDSYISSKSKLKVPGNSYVVLTNKKEVPMGISNPGEYSIADLNEIYKDVGNANLTEEFFDYIANNMIEEDKKVRRSGGVYRAVGDILIAPFDDANCIEKEVRFDWNNPKAKKLYLKIYDVETWEQPYNIETTESSYTLKYDSNIFKKGKDYAWTVYHGKDHPQQGTILRVFRFVDDKWIENFNTQLKEINSGENKDMNRIKTIRYYIDNNVYPRMK